MRPARCTCQFLFSTYSVFPLLQVQDKMDSDQSDDTDSYSAILSVFDALLFCYGADEDEIGEHLEDHKR